MPSSTDFKFHRLYDQVVFLQYDINHCLPLPIDRSYLVDLKFVQNFINPCKGFIPYVRYF